MAALAEGLGKCNGNQTTAGPHGGVSDWEAETEWRVHQLQ